MKNNIKMVVAVSLWAVFFPACETETTPSQPPETCWVNSVDVSGLEGNTCAETDAGLWECCKEIDSQLKK